MTSRHRSIAAVFFVALGLSLSSAACGNHAAAPAAGGADTATRAVASDAAPVASSPDGAATAAAPYRLGTLIHVDALPLLPSPTRVRAGYTGGFLLGAISDDATLQRVAAAGKLRGVPALAPGQVAVYAILDERTNALAAVDFTVDDKGAATFTVRWERIEPFYPRLSPLALTIVNRAAYTTVTVREVQGDAIGSFTLP